MTGNPEVEAKILPSPHFRTLTHDHHSALVKRVGTVRRMMENEPINRGRGQNRCSVASEIEVAEHPALGLDSRRTPQRLECESATDSMDLLAYIGAWVVIRSSVSALAIMRSVEEEAELFDWN